MGGAAAAAPWRRTRASGADGPGHGAAPARHRQLGPPGGFAAATDRALARPLLRERGDHVLAALLLLLASAAAVIWSVVTGLPAVRG